MTTTEGSGPVTVLGPIYLEDVALDRARFLDAAALAALPILIQTADEGEEDAVSITENVWLFADAMLAERDRRRGGERE